MELILQKPEPIFVRSYREKDLPSIQQLNDAEGWVNLAGENDTVRKAWRNSNIAFVMESDKKVIGYIRGMTDTAITLFVCELLIGESYRGMGLGRELLHYVHGLYPETRMEMLANSSSRTFYEKEKFRPFYGFRKTFAGK